MASVRFPKLSQFLRLLISLTRFYFLCATVLLYLSSNVLAASQQGESSVSFKNTANLTKGLVPSREELLNHHRQAMGEYSKAASHHKALINYHHEEAYDDKTSTAGDHHNGAWYEHGRILRGLESNMGWHQKRIAEIGVNRAGGTPEELHEIKASHKFAVAARQNAVEATTKAYHVDLAKAAFSSHRPFKRKPVTEAHHKRNAERQTAKDLYHSATNKTQAHAASFANQWKLPQ